MDALGAVAPGREGIVTPMKCPWEIDKVVASYK
jgi:hypothetical protein